MVGKQCFCGKSILYCSFVTHNQNSYLKIYVKFDFRFHNINQRSFLLVCKDLRLFTDLLSGVHRIATIWLRRALKSILSHFILYVSPIGKRPISRCLSYFEALIISLPLPEMPFFLKFIPHPSFSSSVSSITSTTWIIPLSSKTIYWCLPNSQLAWIFFWA